MLQNLHTHSTFCDGRNAPEEIVLTAIDRGFDSLGFSAHAPSTFNISCELRDPEGYINEIRRLKEKYLDKIIKDVSWFAKKFDCR